MKHENRLKWTQILKMNNHMNRQIRCTCRAMIVKCEKNVVRTDIGKTKYIQNGN